MENLFLAWDEFKCGKESKGDVQEFLLDLEDNIFCLRNDLEKCVYRHSEYTSFFVSDPKLRHIHKAKVRDRLLHHAIFRVIESIFEKSFIFDSYSSRKEKGTHRAVKRFRKFAWKLSQNNTKTVWILKCDVKKFFDSVDHGILLKLLEKKISDKKAIFLLEKIIHSFRIFPEKGIPLGNLTSQLFSNVYLNELDQFIKRELKTKYYIRYADDFVIVSNNKEYLEKMLDKIESYLQKNLYLRLHPKKVKIERWSSGVDFLGYVSFPNYTALRTKTKRRMLKRVKIGAKNWKEKRTSKDSFNATVQSYLGMIRHCRWHVIVKKMKKIIFEK